MTFPALCVCTFLFILDFTKNQNIFLVENIVCLKIECYNKLINASRKLSQR